MRYTIIPVTPYQQNCTLLVCEKTNQAALVDPGGDLELLQQEVKRQGVDLESILVTHGHLDHAGGVAELAAQLKLPIIGPHREDDFWIQALPEHCRQAGFPKSAAFTPTRWLNDGDTVMVGEEVLEVIHCPGHTPGHQSLRLRLAGGETILAADACYFCQTLRERRLPRHVFDREAMLESLDRLQALEANGSRIIFGHDPEFWRTVPQAPALIR